MSKSISSAPIAKPSNKENDLADMIAKLTQRISKLERMKNQRLPPGSLVHMIVPDASYNADGYEGFLICDGSVFNISEYPDLGGLLGNQFGGNGTTTFAVPNLNQDAFGSGGRFLFGDVISGETGGSKNHTHSLSDDAQAQLTTDTAASQLRMRIITASPTYTSNRRATGVSHGSVSTSGENAGLGMQGKTDNHNLATMPVPWFGATIYIKY